jgi:chromosome condensin MukBEF ATPase and DNA-binding subunit MukB
MISGVTSMKGEVNKLAGEDVSIDKDIQAQKVQLENTYNELLKEKKKVDRFKMDIEQYRAEVEDQNLSVPSIQMHHLIWVIMGGAFIATAIYNSR